MMILDSGLPFWANLYTYIVQWLRQNELSLSLFHFKPTIIREFTVNKMHGHSNCIAPINC